MAKFRHARPLCQCAPSTASARARSRKVMYTPGGEKARRIGKSQRRGPAQGSLPPHSPGAQLLGRPQELRVSRGTRACAPALRLPFRKLKKRRSPRSFASGSATGARNTSMRSGRLPAAANDEEIHESRPPGPSLLHLPLHAGQKVHRRRGIPADPAIVQLSDREGVEIVPAEAPLPFDDDEIGPFQDPEVLRVKKKPF